MSDDDSSEPEWVSQHSAQKAALPRDLSSQSSSPVSFQGEGEGEGGAAASGGPDPDDEEAAYLAQYEIEHAKKQV